MRQIFNEVIKRVALKKPSLGQLLVHFFLTLGPLQGLGRSLSQGTKTSCNFLAHHNEPRLAGHLHRDTFASRTVFVCAVLSWTSFPWISTSLLWTPLPCNVAGAWERSLHRFLVPITKIFEALTPVRFANFSKPVVLQYSPKFLLHIHRRERVPSLFRSLIRAVQGCQRHVEDTVCLVGSVSHLKSPRLWTIRRIEKEWHVALDTNCWSHRCVTEFVSLLARTWADLGNWHVMFGGLDR